MKTKKKRGQGLMVTGEAIREFLKASPARRLQWLDETRAFLSKALPSKTKEIWLKMRERK